MIVLRILAAYLVAVFVAASLGSAFHSWEVQNGLIAAGLDFPVADRVKSALEDYRGLVFGLYGVIFAIALAVGFVVAALLRLVLRPLSSVAFELAGAGAIALALYLMSQQYNHTTPIAGARGWVGFTLQCVAGAIGGHFFSNLLPRKR